MVKKASAAPDTANKNRPSHRAPTAADPTIAAVAQIERAAYDARSAMDHIAAWITRKAGSGTAIFLHVVWFALWLLINFQALPGITPFDHFPFNLLTMVVSLEAIFLTLFVLISQNRMSQEADKRAQLDLQVNLLAERETTMILEMLRGISEKLGVKEARREDLAELLKETRIEELAKKLDQALPSSD
jgi:uncharacterized membrane protein